MEVELLKALFGSQEECSLWACLAGLQLWLLRRLLLEHVRRWSCGFTCEEVESVEPQNPAPPAPAPAPPFLQGAGALPNRAFVCASSFSFILVTVWFVLCRNPYSGMFPVSNNHGGSSTEIG